MQESRLHLAADFCESHNTFSTSLVVRFVATSWIRDNQFSSDGVSELLHRSGVFLIIRAPITCQNQCITRMQPQRDA